MADTEKITIRTYNDFRQQLEKVKTSESEIVLSYYKYCNQYNTDDDLDFDFYKDLVLDELKPLGLIPERITQNMDLIFKFKDEAEAIIHIKPFGIDLCIMKK